MRHRSIVTDDECKAASCKKSVGMKDRNRFSALMQRLQPQGWNSNCSSSDSTTLKTRIHTKWILNYIRVIAMICFSSWVNG